MNNNNKDIIEWIATVILLFAFWPLGLLLLFLKLKKPSNRNSNTNSYSNTTYSRVTRTDDSSYGHVHNTTTGTYTEPKKSESTKQPAKAERPKPKNTGATVLLVLAILLFVVSADQLSDVINIGNLGSIMSTIFYFLGGAASLATSVFLRRRTKRYLKYLSVMGVDDAKSVKEIAVASGYSAKTVRKDLDYMAGRGYFGPEAYFDIGLDSIVISQAAAENERNIRYAQEVASGAAQPTTQDKYAKALARLHELKNTISDEVISSKTSKIEELAAKIFKIAQDEPEKERDIRKFSEYYLPATEKLLRSYNVLEKQGVSGQNITTTKQEIERILDTLIAGYEKQLDKLFGSDALDISSDIDVLENMLKRDGLAGEQLGGH